MNDAVETFSPRVMADILDALNTICKGGPLDKRFGICNNVVDVMCYQEGSDYSRRVMHFLETVALGWASHSGDARYPVPHPTAPANYAYAGADDCWAGVYGNSRRELLDFLIAELTLWVSGAKND